MITILASLIFFGAVLPPEGPLVPLMTYQDIEVSCIDALENDILACQERERQESSNAFAAHTACLRDVFDQRGREACVRALEVERAAIQSRYSQCVFDAFLDYSDCQGAGI